MIYDLYSPRIYRYAMRLLGDDCLSEDCVAETFSRFLNAVHSGKGPKIYLQAYLFRSAHNWIVDYCRRNSVQTDLLDETMHAADQLLPENQADLEMEKYQVRSALLSLTPEQQQVITLRFIEGWENAEVARVLQKPVGAVKALQHRALEMLRRKLRPKEDKNGYEFER